MALPDGFVLRPLQAGGVRIMEVLPPQPLPIWRRRYSRYDKCAYTVEGYRCKVGARWIDVQYYPFGTKRSVPLLLCQRHWKQLDEYQDFNI